MFGICLNQESNKPTVEKMVLEIKPVNPKGNQSWVFIGRTDAKAEAPILWPPDAKNWLIGKDLDAGKDWRQEKGMTEDEMVRWHDQLYGCEFEEASGEGDGQGSWCATKSQAWHELNWGNVMMHWTLGDIQELLFTLWV